MYKSIKVSEFLHRVKEPVELQPDQEYSLVTIKVHHKGVVFRNRTKGKLIGSKMYKISKGQFILSGIDARNGAFGIVPDELDGAIVTNDFWYFDIDETKVKRDFFYWLTNTPLFLNACIKSSQGITQRIRLQRKLFFDFEFCFPPLEEQEIFLEKIQQADQGLKLLKIEQEKQEKYISQLKKAILQEAISGQITAEWRKQNPIQKGDPDSDAAALLAKIKAEKQQAIADGKLKKEKPLPEISPDEIPFSLPDGWVWCRLGNICTKIGSGSTPRGSDYSEKGIPFFRSQNIHNNGLVFNDIKYISSEIHRKMNGTAMISGDLLLNITGGSLGRCALVPENVNDGNVSQHVCIIRPLLLNNKFFHFLILSPLFQTLVFKHTTGAGREGLPKYNLECFIIPIPPLTEQKAIVEKVDYLMNIIDQLEEQIKHRKQLAEDLMQTVLREAFE